jgi:hypothetical protein
LAQIGRELTIAADHDIQPTKLVDGGLDQSLYFAFLADIALDGNSLSIWVPLVDEFSNTLDGFEVDIGEDNTGTLRREHESGLSTDAAGDGERTDVSC